MIESAVTFDCAQLVVDNIDAVGPFGDFLSSAGTLRHMHEQSRSDLIDRRVRENRAAAGAKDLY